MKRLSIMALLTATLVGTSVQCTSSKAADINDHHVYVDNESSGVTTEKNIKLTKEFGAVSVSMGVKVYYTVGNAKTVRIVGPEEKVNRTSVTVEDNTLRISMTGNNRIINSSNYQTVIAYVEAPAFKKVNVSVGGCMEMESPLKLSGNFEIEGDSGGIFKSDYLIACDDFEVDSSSGCIVEVNNVKADEMDLDGSSGSIITVKGVANKLDADFSSGAIANIESVKVKSGNLDASSGAIVNASSSNGYRTHSSSGAILNLK